MDLQIHLYICDVNNGMSFKVMLNSCKLASFLIKTCILNRVKYVNMYMVKSVVNWSYFVFRSMVFGEFPVLVLNSVV